MEFVERPFSASHEVIGFVKVQLLQLGFIEHKAPCEIKSRQRQVAHSEIERPVLAELAGIPHILIPPGFVEVESVDIREIVVSSAVVSVPLSFSGASDPHADTEVRRRSDIIRFVFI